MAGTFKQSGGSKRNPRFGVSFQARDRSRRFWWRVGADRATANAIKRRIDWLEKLRLSGEPLDAETARWLESVPTDLRDKLVAADFIEGRRVAAMKPLTAHLVEYESDLRTTATAGHAAQAAKRLDSRT